MNQVAEPEAKKKAAKPKKPSIGRGYSAVVQSPEQGRIIMERGWAWTLNAMRLGEPVRIEFGRARPQDRTIQQNRYYWGVLLKEISDQVMLEGQWWVSEAWHEYFKRKFLGYSIEKVKIAGKRRAHVIRRLKSTADLEIGPFNKYLEQITAYAVLDLGVYFSVTDWRDYE
jgi:hypothetical protein